MRSIQILICCVEKNSSRSSLLSQPRHLSSHSWLSFKSNYSLLTKCFLLPQNYIIAIYNGTVFVLTSPQKLSVISNVKESTDLYSREASICDFRIQTTGTAGWGGYALASALYLLRVCPIHDRYRRRAIGFPPTEKDLQMFQTALPDIEKVMQFVKCVNDTT